MVAVGDDELFVGHGGGDDANGGRVGYAPEAVEDAVLVGDFGFGGPAAVEEGLFHAGGGVGVEHEDLAEVGVGGLEQVEAVALGLGEGLLVAEDDLFGVVMELAEGDKAAALFHDFSAGNLETLGIGEEAGVLFLDQDALIAPGAEVATGAGVDALAAFGIEEFGQAEDDADKVVGAALVVSLLHRRGDLVVGLCHDVVQTDGGGAVTPGAKWINAGHTKGLAPCLEAKTAHWSPTLARRRRMCAQG